MYFSLILVAGVCGFLAWLTVDTIVHSLTATPAVPLGLPAAPGWRPETAWAPVDGGLTLMNPLRWQWNANPCPVGTDRDWLPPLPDWLRKELTD